MLENKLAELIILAIVALALLFLMYLKRKPAGDGIEKGKKDIDKEKKVEVTDEIEISIRCFKCGKTVSVNDKMCPDCGVKFESIIPITENKLPEKKLKNDSEQKIRKEKNQDEKYTIKKKTNKNIMEKEKESTGSLAVYLCLTGLLFAMLVFIMCLG